MSTATCI